MKEFLEKKLDSWSRVRNVQDNLQYLVILESKETIKDRQKGLGANLYRLLVDKAGVVYASKREAAWIKIHHICLNPWIHNKTNNCPHQKSPKFIDHLCKIQNSFFGKLMNKGKNLAFILTFLHRKYTTIIKYLMRGSLSL